MFFNGGFRLLLLFLLLGFSTSTTISYGIFQTHEHNGRSLLQAISGCSINFESANYTILTSRCKGPKYTADVCCAAFKEFACPYVAQINDLKSACATTMFSYINLYGKYPPGLFANLCVEGKEGLFCPTPAPESANSGTHKSGAPVTFPRSSAASIIIAAALAFFFLAYV